MRIFWKTVRFGKLQTSPEDSPWLSRHFINKQCVLMLKNNSTFWKNRGTPAKFSPKQFLIFLDFFIRSLDMDTLHDIFSGCLKKLIDIDIAKSRIIFHYFGKSSITRVCQLQAKKWMPTFFMEIDGSLIWSH